MAVSRDLGVVNSFTMEASFCGPGIGKNKHMHFNQSDLEGVGRDFCKTLLDLVDPNQGLVREALTRFEQRETSNSGGSTTATATVTTTTATTATTASSSSHSVI